MSDQIVMPDQIAHMGDLVIQVVAMPADTNANGDIFGGWLVSYMDMGAGIAAKRRSRSRAVTVAIQSLVFIKPVNVGDIVSFYSYLIKVGRTSMQFKIEVWTMGFDDDIQKKVSEGVFTFVAIDQHGHPRAVDRPQKK